MAAEAFSDWSCAFDACRERNRPLLACVDGEVCKIFPSGRSERQPAQRSARIEEAQPETPVEAECPVCGCEARTPAGYLQCECPTPLGYAADATDAYEYDHGGGAPGYGASAVVNPFTEEGLRQDVAQAAERLRGLHQDPEFPAEPAFCRWCDLPAVILNSECGKPACFHHEHDSSPPHGTPVPILLTERDRLLIDRGIAQTEHEQYRRMAEEITSKLREQRDTLQTALDHATTQHVAMQTELEWIQSEVERLCEEIVERAAENARLQDQFVALSRGAIAAAASFVTSEKQREALADSLEQYRAFFDRWGMVRENLGPKGKAHLGWVEKQGEAALKLAGRTP